MIQIGDVVSVTTHDWNRYGLHGAVAIVTPPRLDRYPVTFELLFKPRDWSYDYFHLDADHVKEADKYMQVVGHLDV